MGLWVLPPRLQFLMNYSSVGPFRRVQSFRSSLLQFGSLVELQALPPHLFQHRLFSPCVHRSLPGAYSIIDLSWLSLLQPYLCQCGLLHGLQVDLCFHMAPSPGPSLSGTLEFQHVQYSSAAPTICQSLCVTIAVLKMSPSTAE
ncbi:hypothetical protein DUI87_14651 [Hirundo rustica rustica]|uniref:Uncharacterized protein n=1 Tax=Hirundo rustica rustica TaxID=333673 RepID=A0A3M0KMH0_HIRRU|nr:hypothetical protein DUI87_14651 [Hirundo rustica rustica]